MIIILFIFVIGFTFVFVSCAQRENKKITELNVLNVDMLKKPDTNSLGKFEMIYIVKDGDDIYKIAKIVDTTTIWLIKRNYITDASNIYPGRKLIVPTV